MRDSENGGREVRHTACIPYTANYNVWFCCISCDGLVPH